MSFDIVAGVDEAGRGPLAGPVLVAAVILDPRRRIRGLGDSKALSVEERQRLAPIIRARALAWKVVAIDVEAIDRLNILGATLLGMRLALEALHPKPARAWIDGNRMPPGLPCPAQCLVSGDALRSCISAASILAKVERDRLMCDMDTQHPGYGFASHKGYPTPDHFDALARLGPCAIHRRSFAPVRQAMQGSLVFA